MANKKPEEVVESEVELLVQEEKSLTEREAELMAANPALAEFLQAQKTFQERSVVLWESIRQQMEKHDIKSIKGDWGSITLANRVGFNINADQLQPKFLKKVPDIKKIGDTFKLSGKAPKGATPTYTKYLMKRIK